MANLLDCPREIRDQIYTEYFASALQENPMAPLHASGLLRASKSLAIEAIGAAKPVISAALANTRKEQTSTHLEIKRALRDAGFSSLASMTEAPPSASRNIMGSTINTSNRLAREAAKQQYIEDTLTVLLDTLMAMR